MGSLHSRHPPLRGVDLLSCQAKWMISWTMPTLYGIWLLAGALDFHFHRRTDIAHTSSLRESVLHGVQLCLIGCGTLAWLLLAHTLSLAAGLGAVVVAHAIAGYLDTLSADGVRRISPAEQHVHSILDVAPWLFLAWVFWQAAPEWALQLAPQPVHVWLWILTPALLLTGAPWVYELLRCLHARRSL